MSVPCMGAPSCHVHYMESFGAQSTPANPRWKGMLIVCTLFNKEMQERVGDTASLKDLQDCKSPLSEALP